MPLVACHRAAHERTAGAGAGAKRVKVSRAPCWCPIETSQQLRALFLFEWVLKLKVDKERASFERDQLADRVNVIASQTFRQPESLVRRIIGARRPGPQARFLANAQRRGRARPLLCPGRAVGPPRGRGPASPLAKTSVKECHGTR
eukprot:4114489-Pyramimonas_sp.AAC.1